jgi:AcrR family transcriptional regulator
MFMMLLILPARQARTFSSPRTRLRGLSPEAVVGDQRHRIFAALGVVLTRRGYTRMTVEEVIELAGVSRRTFYSLFDSKSGAFCVAHGEAMASLEERIHLACRSTSGWPQMVEAAVGAAVKWAITEPSRASLIASEFLTAGPHMAYSHDCLVNRFGPCLEAGRAFSSAELSPSLEEGLLGGLVSLVGIRLRSGAVGSLRVHAPALTEYLLTPYLGPRPERHSIGLRGS